MVSNRRGQACRSGSIVRAELDVAAQRSSRPRGGGVLHHGCTPQPPCACTFLHARAFSAQRIAVLASRMVRLAPPAAPARSCGAVCSADALARPAMLISSVAGSVIVLPAIQGPAISSMTTNEPAERVRPSSGRPHLTKLVAAIAEIVAQGEDSGSQSQASDGGLRIRLRSVLLALLDGIVGDDSAGAWQQGEGRGCLPAAQPPPPLPPFKRGRQAADGRDGSPSVSWRAPAAMNFSDNPRDRVHSILTEPAARRPRSSSASWHPSLPSPRPLSPLYHLQARSRRWHPC